MNKKVFCAIEQKVTDHEVTIDNNGEYLLSCACGAFIKLPGDTTKEERAQFLKAHEDQNKGQVTTAQIEKENQEKLKNF